MRSYLSWLAATVVRDRKLLDHELIVGYLGIEGGAREQADAAFRMTRNKVVHERRSGRPCEDRDR